MCAVIAKRRAVRAVVGSYSGGVNREIPADSARSCADEMTTTLRQSIEELTYACPKRCYVPKCPFQALSGLSVASRRSLLTGLEKNELCALFELAPCACPADPRPRRGDASR